MKTKTNAMRMLEQAGIEYTALEYEADENDLSGLHIARQLSMNPDMMFKTIVAKGENRGILVFCIPVSCEIDLKKAAASAKDKRVELLPVKELLSYTGYIRGGCTAVGMKKQYKTVYDASCLSQPTMLVSGGRIGTQVEVVPADLIRVTRGITAEITAEHP